MPQYKIIFLGKDEKVRTYVRYGENAEQATAFTPRDVIGQDYDNPVPVEGEITSVKEMEVSIIFQLDSESYAEVQEIAKSQNLHSEKATGSYCLKVSGMGDWPREPWVKNYTILNSEWVCN